MLENIGKNGNASCHHQWFPPLMIFPFANICYVGYQKISMREHVPLCLDPKISIKEHVPLRLHSKISIKEQNKHKGTAKVSIKEHVPLCLSISKPKGTRSPNLFLYA